MECCHSLCDNCYPQLISNSCPFCRREIVLPSCKISNEESDDDDTLFFDNDFLIPVRSNKNRQQCKRKKEEKKRQNLEYLQMITNSSFYTPPIPNKKKRLHKN